MKKILFFVFLFVLTIFSFIHPNIIVTAARDGILIWFEQILPALLPFTILSGILIKSGFLNSIQKHTNLMAVFFTMLCGFVFGFPIGAKLSADFYKEKMLSYKQANMLAVFTNNFSALYVCGFVLPYLFSGYAFHISTYFLLYFFPLIILTFYILVIGIKDTVHPSTEKKTSSFRLTMQTIDASILSGFESLIKICGYIVLFSIIAKIIIVSASEIMNQNNTLIIALLANLEITNGIKLLSQINQSYCIRYVLTIQLLSFGSISGIAQTASILSDSRLSIYKYIIGKALLSLLLTLLTVIYVLFV